MEETEKTVGERKAHCTAWESCFEEVAKRGDLGWTSRACKSAST